MRILRRGGISLAAVMACCTPVFAQENILIEFVTDEGEYEAQYRGILDLYTLDHPNVEIVLTTVNESTEAAFNARIASGDVPDVRENAFPTVDNYQIYANLLELDVDNWQFLDYDARTLFEQVTGVEGYQPTFSLKAGPYRSFIYYVDDIEAAGADPSAIKTPEDVVAFMETVKAYVESDPDVDFVMHAGWLPGAWGRFNPEVWAFGLGATKEEIGDVFLGKIAWTDQENNPFVPYFEMLKTFYDRGLMPERWWTLDFDQDFGAGWQAHKSATIFHGPWSWDSVLASDADAELDGFFWPPNKENKIWAGEITSDFGTAIYADALNDEHLPEIVDFFNWWNSPEIVKLRAEAIGFAVAMNLSSVGGADMFHEQFRRVVQPVLDGRADGATFDRSLCGSCRAERFYVSGTPRVLQDNAMAEIYGDYLEERISMSELLQILQERWERAYDIPE